MNVHARALVQRITANHAIQHAKQIAAESVQSIRTGWDQPIKSLFPGAEANTVFPVNEAFSASVWMGPAHKLDFPRMEQFWRLLSAIAFRLVFEIAGNKHWVRFSIRGHKADAAIVRDAYAGLFEGGALSTDDAMWWRAGQFAGYYEVEPRWHPSRLTLPDTQPDSFLRPFIEWLSQFDDSVGFYQCVVQSAGVTDYWHREVELHHDLAHHSAVASLQSALVRYPQHHPSSDLRIRADELSKKANPDEGFNAVAIRIGVIADAPSPVEPPHFLASIRTDGRALELRASVPPPQAMREQFFRTGASTCTGILLNSSELTTIAHFLPARESGTFKPDWPIFGGEVPATLQTGTLVGHATVTGTSVEVRIPSEIRAKGIHIIAAPGSGKSTILKSMLLQDAKAGNGAVFFDPHGDASVDILSRLDDETSKRVIYFNPGDPDNVPCWNPLALSAGADPYILASGLLTAFKRISQHWGDRIEAVLRNAFLALLYLERSTFEDLYNLTRHKSPESEALRLQIIQRCPFPIVRNFWQRDFVTAYSPAEIASCQNKLLKLISGGPVSRMLSQRESRIDIRKVIDNKQLLLVDLSRVGREVCEFLGSFMLTLFVEAALSRASREHRSPYSIYADEAHSFVDGDSIETLMAQGRKYGINAVFAHQMLSQFRATQIESLKNAGSTLIGKVDFATAQSLAKEFHGKITAEEITQLRPFHMVGRIGTDVVRFQTPASNDLENTATAARVIAASHKEYYLPSRRREAVTANAPTTNDLSYDEF